VEINRRRSPVTTGPANAEPGRCSVMEQKQTHSGFVDEPCGKQVPADFAGLCEYVYSPLVCGSDMRSSVHETLSRSKGQRLRSQGHAT